MTRSPFLIAASLFATHYCHSNPHNANMALMTHTLDRPRSHSFLLAERSLRSNFHALHYAIHIDKVFQTRATNSWIVEIVSFWTNRLPGCSERDIWSFGHMYVIVYGMVRCGFRAEDVGDVQSWKMGLNLSNPLVGWQVATLPKVFWKGCIVAGANELSWRVSRSSYPP